MCRAGGKKLVTWPCLPCPGPLAPCRQQKVCWSEAMAGILPAAARHVTKDTLVLGYLLFSNIALLTCRKKKGWNWQLILEWSWLLYDQWFLFLSDDALLSSVDSLQVNFGAANWRWWLKCQEHQCGHQWEDYFCSKAQKGKGALLTHILASPSAYIDGLVLYPVKSSSRSGPSHLVLSVGAVGELSCSSYPTEIRFCFSAKIWCFLICIC